MQDTNGDLKADTKELVTDSYGRREANVEHNANSLLVGARQLDLHVGSRRLPPPEGRQVRGRRRRCRAASGALRRTMRGASTATRTHRRCTSTSCRRRYFMRNPTLTRTRGSYESLGSDGDDLNAVWPVRPTPRRQSRLSGRRAARRRHAGDVHGGRRADGLSRRSAAGGAVRQRVRRRAGRQSRQPRDHRATTARRCAGEKAYDRGEFLASTDERFRPVYLSSAPDGTLYVVDMYRGIIQHRGYITEYLRDQIVSRNLEQPTGMRPHLSRRPRHDAARRDSRRCRRRHAGRSWWARCRIRTAGGATPRSGCWSSAATRPWSPALKKLAERAPDPRTRLHALWTLDGMDASTRAA